MGVDGHAGSIAGAVTTKRRYAACKRKPWLHAKAQVYTSGLAT